MAKSAICENIFDGGSIPGLSFLHHDQSDTLTQAVTFHLLQRCRGVNEKAIHAPATIPLPGVYIYIQLCIVYLKQIYIYIPVSSNNILQLRGQTQLPRHEWTRIFHVGFHPTTKTRSFATCHSQKDYRAYRNPPQPKRVLHKYVNKSAVSSQL